MRRIYLESFIGVIIFFVLAMGCWNYIINQVTPDNEYILEEHKAEALQDLVNVIVDNQGIEVAVEHLQNYADKTKHILAVYDLVDAPGYVKEAFSMPDRKVLFEDNDIRGIWFYINDSSSIFSMYENNEDPLRKSIMLDVGLLFVSFFSSFALYCFAFITLISYRVRALEKATYLFASGDFTARASVKGYKRVGTLNQSFNYMADKVSGLITSNRSLTNAVAHELRTPIFRIQWQAEILSSSTLSEEQQSYVASILEDSEEMEEMVEELLYYARMEQPDVQLNLQSININQWLKKQTLRWKRETSTYIELTPLAEDIYIDGDIKLLKRAIDNLIRNAYKYAKNYIQIIISKDGNSIVITVNDDGKGVDKKHWPFLFNAFYSASESRNKKQSGHGLGLAIVKQIALCHNASLEVGHSKLGGASFRFCMPITQQLERVN
ncbi:Sensor histidine kinase [Vibrio nigripulchritudo SFn27]|uniref:histidine kinase n=1 Tax=Vibrio nigripulchritudo TaxID=28173 RepID=A0A9P1JLV5_9VIBR|nr:ATP-binding protein [Vibrio nigripulchritudo]CBJ93182.1 Putative sensor protein [Vibrio nigripulchritudo]CCN38702.1 Sensor histidine kinase [Vibrio nigripulchritudo AM115]CCN45010.1 Sensor histidine kinase [Vibrio nigripulchritudo FTn2]CCN79768.1 Sensor histidine kinase [Vibrio nigripulchritudo SO65]CCN91992.1 Sensor histidine kinase [Vibrio nigripulchritudo SFn27]